MSDLKKILLHEDSHQYLRVIGEFEDDAAVTAYLAEHFVNDKRTRFLLLEGVIRIGAPPNPLEKPEAEKLSPGNFARYEKDGDGGFRCKECHAVILSQRVAHPIWDGPSPMSGHGECRYEEVPYCPNCERKPNFSGAPITIKP